MIQKPSSGRIVVYILTDEQKNIMPNGGQSTCAAMITRVLGDTRVNLRLFTDSDTTHWIRDVELGTKPGTWSWPVIVTPTVKTDGDAKY